MSIIYLIYLFAFLALFLKLWKCCYKLLWIAVSHYALTLLFCPNWGWIYAFGFCISNMEKMPKRKSLMHVIAYVWSHLCLVLWAFLGLPLFQLVAACLKSCKLWTTGCTWIFHLHSWRDSWEDAEGHTPAHESRLIFYCTSWWIVVFYCVILCNFCVILEHPNFSSSVGLDSSMLFDFIFTQNFEEMICSEIQSRKISAAGFFLFSMLNSHILL